MSDKPNVGGRPSKFSPDMLPQIEKLCILGATDADVADFIGIRLSTLYKWKIDHPGFSDSLKRGKEVADATVEDRLFKRATGYSHEAVKIFMPAGAENPVYAPYVEHVPPDPTSMIFWLKNRRPDLWRDKHEVVQSGTVIHEHAFNKAALDALSRDDLEQFSNIAGRLLAAPEKAEKAN